MATGRTPGTAVGEPGHEIVCHTTLRGIAALVVVLYHCALFTSARGSDPMQDLFAHGFICVDLFFVLSGFIIHHRNTARFEAPADLAAGFGRFFLRRLIRIYPNYIVWFAVAVLAVSAVSLYQTGRIEAGRTETISFVMHVLMIQSLVVAPFLWNVPLWSIAVEVIAYALFPALALARNRAPVLFDTGAGLALASGFAVLLAVWGSLDVIIGLPSVLRCLSGFCLGMILSAHHHRVAHWSAPVLALAQGAGFALSAWAVATGAEAAAIAGFALLVLASSVNRGPLLALLALPPLHFLGKISFSIYLAHIPVLTLYIASMGRAQNLTGLPFLDSFSIMAPIVCLITIAAAAVSYRILERPSQRWLQARLLTRPQPR